MNPKKTICLLLAVFCLLSLCACGGSAAPSADAAPAIEAEQAEPEAEEVAATPEPEAVPPYEPLETQFGFRFEYPEEYQHLKGELAWWIRSFYNTEATATLYYVAVPDGERAAFREKVALSAKNIGGWVPGWTREYRSMSLFSVQAIFDSDNTVKYYETMTPLQYIKSFWGENAGDAAQRTNIPVYQNTVALENNWTLVVQRHETYTFGGEAIPITDDVWDLGEGYREEVLALFDDPELFASGLKEAAWERPGQVGSRVSFETKTLQGETVNNEDIFSGHKVTMVNVWATWCGPCIAEMSDLEKLNAAFAEKDCQIVGVCLDASDAETIDEALGILEEGGVTYPNLEMNMDLLWANVRTVPTFFFVSEDGTILTEPLVGQDINACSRALNQALSLIG